MSGRRKAPSNALGRALINERRKAMSKTTATSEKEEYAMRHTTLVHDGQGDRLKSVTEQGDLNEFLAVADLMDEQFQSEKQHVVVLESSAFQMARTQATPEQLALQKELWDRIRVPRRPAWNRKMTAEELHKREREAFLKWRRALAEVEEKENILLTPFEKNLNVWRQLWRVVQMSHVLVQIVDARDPELYRCIDLENYAREVNAEKKTMLLLNKADLLTKNQRRAWARYYKSIGVDAMFFSALPKEETESALQQDATAAATADKQGSANDPAAESEKRQQPPPAPVDDDEHENDDEEERQSDSVEEKSNSNNANANNANNKNDNDNGSRNENDDEINDNNNNNNNDGDGMEKAESVEGEAEDDHLRVLTPAELVARFEAMSREEGLKEGERYMVGFCGYPNVGKSSTINALMGEKRVTVSSTPGKTKHFQTLHLGDLVCLCDCPGLVFPNFVVTKAEMICSGLLPIDEMREYRSAVSLVCQRVKRSVLEALYGIILPKPDVDVYGVTADSPPTPDELLNAYAYVRGFMGASGTPNGSRAARIILKQYVNGVLKFCKAPPDDDGSFDSQEAQDATEILKAKNKSVPSSERRAQQKPTYVESDPDFERYEAAARGRVHFTNRVGPGITMAKKKRGKNRKGRRKRK